MRKIADIASYIFILSLIVLGFISVLGIWDLADPEVISKSFLTIAFLAVFAVVISLAGRALDRTVTDPAMVPAIDPGFKMIRHVTLGTLIISASVLALVGVLAIWEVLAGDVTMRSLSTLATIGFISFVIVMVCLERENHPLLHRQGKNWSLGSVILVLFLGYLALGFLGAFF